MADAVPRHSGGVRLTHWITTLCFAALLLSGLEILISHPRFYWGEAGNVMTTPLFSIPIPASRSSVPTGYGYVLPDQNGWSRSLHFQAAWGAVITGVCYFLAGLWSGHFRRDLLPSGDPGGAHSYNPIQRLTYLVVVFVLFPLMIWTGLAMSPAVSSAFPATMSIFGGQQSARTIHFFDTAILMGFVLVHIVMVYRAGFKQRVGAMITGRITKGKEHV